MSETADRRRRTDLDLFILALIEEGISTPYEFQKSAGISQGASIPALQRLLKAGYLYQGEPGARGRIGHRLTAPGRKLLRDGWRSLIEAGPSGNIDSDLRVALLALGVGRDHRAARDFLRKSAERDIELKQPSKSREADEDVPLARWFRELRSETATALVAAESEVIRRIADSLPRNLALASKRRST